MGIVKRALMGLLLVCAVGAHAESNLYAGKTLHIYGPWPKLQMPALIMNGLTSTLIRKDTTLGDNWFTINMVDNTWGGIYLLGGQIQNGKDTTGDWGKQYGVGGFAVKDGNNQTQVTQWTGNGTATDLFPAGANEIWVVPDPNDPNGNPVTMLHRPFILRALIPAEWTLGAPLLAVNGAAPVPMRIDPTRCGWFWYMFLTEPPYAISFVNSNDGETYGAKTGYEDATAWDLTGQFNTISETWLQPEEVGPAGYGLFTADDPQIDGECTYNLGAIVRDFDDSHPDFYGNNHSSNQNPCQGNPLNGLKRGIVSQTLDADRLPTQMPSSTCFHQFDDLFHDVANVNTKTCIDIPMEKTADGLWEYDAWNDPSRNFLPIDDLPGPHNQKSYSCFAIPSENFTDSTPADSVGASPYTYDWHTDPNTPPNALHNFDFCMESHANFKYAKGQTFAFRGDDDIWVYLAGRLAIDFGNLHIPLPGMVKLDTLHDATGNLLVEGSTYDFDLFACERNPCGSNIRIKTSMYFQQKKSLYGNLTGNTYEICNLKSGGGSCDALVNPDAVPVCGADLAPSLKFTIMTSRGEIIDADPSTEGVLDTNMTEGLLVYGGLKIEAGKLTIDTSKIAGLAPGRYKILVQSGSAKYSIIFKVLGLTTFYGVNNVSCLTNSTKCRAAMEKLPAVDTLAGRMVSFEVAKGTLDGLDSAAASFQLSIPPGLLVFEDSLATVPVTSNQTINTGDDGYIRLWATSSRKSKVDTITYPLVLKGSKSLPLQLRFHMPRIAFVKDSLTVWPDTLGNPKPRLGDKMNFAYMNHPVYLVAYDPVGGTFCFDCNDTLSSVTKDTLSFFSTSGGPVLLLENGRATIMVRGLGKIVNGSFVMQGPTPLMLADWAPVDLDLPPVPVATSAAIYDRTSDGHPDHIIVNFDRSISAVVDSMPDFMVVRWPSEKPDTLIFVGRGKPTPLFSKSGDVPTARDSILLKMYPSTANDEVQGHASTLGTSVDLPYSYETVNTKSVGEVDTWFTFTKDGEQFQIPMTINIEDSMPPVVARARIKIGNTSSVYPLDTLVVTLSEPVDTVGMDGTPFEFKMLSSTAGSGAREVPAFGSKWNAKLDTLQLYYEINSDHPHMNDSVRISLSGSVLADKKGNLTSIDNPWVRIEGVVRPAVTTVHYAQFNPATVEERKKQSPVFVTGVSMADDLKTVNEKLFASNGGPVLGHVIRTDLAEVYSKYATQYSVKNKGAKLNPDSVALHYETTYSTNLGGSVAHGSGIVSCGDSTVFGSDPAGCTGSGNGFVFVGWNLTSDQHRLVGTGAYVSQIRTWVTIPSLGTIKDYTLDKREIWGVARSKGVGKMK